MPVDLERLEKGLDLANISWGPISKGPGKWKRWLSLGLSLSPFAQKPPRYLILTSLMLIQTPEGSNSPVGMSGTAGTQKAFPYVSVYGGVTADLSSTKVLQHTQIYTGRTDM